MFIGLLTLIVLALLSPDVVVAQRAYATATPTGPRCVSSPFTSCGYPLGVKIDGPASVTGWMGYTPFLTSPPAQWTDSRTFRLLIPNTAEPSYGVSGNGGMISGCGFANSSAYARVNYPGYTYANADDGTPFAGNALLLNRVPGCGNDVRQYLASSLGISLLILVNNLDSQVPGVPRNTPSLTVLGETGRLYNFPALVVTQSDGTKLINLFRSNSSSVVYVTMNGAGNVDAPTRAAIGQLATGLTSTLSLRPLSNVLPWSAVNTDPLMDPCFDRIQGLWCELGKPILINFVPTVYIIAGTIHDAGFSTLSTSLAIVRFNDLQDVRGPFPSSFCSLVTKFYYIYSGQNSFTSLPDCWDTAAPELQFILWTGNGRTFIPTFPTSLFRHPSLAVLVYRGLQSAAQTPASLTGMTNLQYLDVSTNALSGTLPNITAMQLSGFIFSSNPVSGMIDPTQFDWLPFLTTFQVRSCNATGPLPNLKNSTSFLTTVDFSFNRFTGGIPSTWTPQWLSTLTQLPLRNNYLSSGADGTALNALASAINLQVLDLSNNWIAGGITLPLQWVILLSSASAVTATLDLSFNRFTGPVASFGTAFSFSVNTRFTTVNFAGNQLTAIPGDLNAYNRVISWNFSSNALTGYCATLDVTQITPGLPPAMSAILQILDVTNNPQLFSSVVPTYLATNRLSSVRLSGQSYSCYPLIGSTLFPFLQVKVDPGFLAFTNCFCADGFYGAAPNCQLIPISNLLGVATPVLDPLATVPINQTYVPSFPNSFSDNWYGPQRALQGIDTVWTVDLSLRGARLTGSSFNYVPLAQADLPFVVIYLEFFFDLSVFDDRSDRITVYQGGSSLDGAIVSIITGSNNFVRITNSSSIVASKTQSFRNFLGTISNLGYSKIQVLGSKASVNFQSRAQSNLHFMAMYSGDYQCPNGYEIQILTGQCQLIKDEFIVSSGIRYAIYAIAAAVCLLNAVVFLVILRYRSTALVRASSFKFMLFSLVMLCFMSGSAVLYAIVPNGSNGDAICHARVWCSAISLMSVLGVLVAKSLRISIIFGSKVLIQIRAITDMYVLRIILSLLSVQFLMLGVFSGLKMTEARFGGIGDQTVWECWVGNGFDAWMGVQVAIFACVMLSGGLVAYKTRSAPSAFNESSHILSSLQTLIIFLILLVPLDWALVNNSPNAAIVNQGGGQLLLCLSLLLANYIPKLYYLLTNRGDDKSLIMTHETKSSLKSSKSTSEMQSVSSVDGSAASSSQI